MVPKAIEVRAQGVHTRGVQLVQPPIARSAIDDQVGAFENPQMLGDRRPADWESTGKLADRLRPSQQALEDRPPCRVAERIELARMLVSNH